VQAIAPVVVTYVAEHFSDATALVLVASFAAAALICFTLIRRPGGEI